MALDVTVKKLNQAAATATCNTSAPIFLASSSKYLRSFQARARLTLGLKPRNCFPRKKIIKRKRANVHAQDYKCSWMAKVSSRLGLILSSVPVRVSSTKRALWV